jgi:hypothetical protein
LRFTLFLLLVLGLLLLLYGLGLPLGRRGLGRRRRRRRLGRRRVQLGRRLIHDRELYDVRQQSSYRLQVFRGKKEASYHAYGYDTADEHPSSAILLLRFRF